MANSRLTSLTAITTPAAGDKLYIVDVSDTSEATVGSSRQITFDNLSIGVLSASGITASVAELNYVDGVTSAIQTQLNAKQATITGAATTIDTEDLTASKALVSNASGKVAVSTTTATELGYVNGVTSAIQAQINLKSPIASPTFTGTVTLPATNIGGNVNMQTYTISNAYISSPVITETATVPIIQGSASAASFPQVKGAKVLGAVGATETVNWVNGDRQFLTLDENLTITFSNPAEGQTLTLYLLQDGTGTNTITFADTIIWANATTPSWTTTADKMNIAVITYIGSVYYGVGNAFA